MGLDIYFKEDIRNALLAADEASTSTARACYPGPDRSVYLNAFLEGYRAALTTVALAFGLSPQILSQYQPALLDAGGGEGQDQTSEVEVEEDVVHIVPDRIWE